MSYLWNDCLKSALNFMSSSVIDPNCFSVISASVGAIGLLWVGRETLMRTIKNVDRHEKSVSEMARYLLVLRIFRKWERSRFAGGGRRLLSFRLINCVVNRFVTASTVAGELAELLECANIVFGEENGWALILFAILLVPRIVSRIGRVLGVCWTRCHLVEAVRQMTARKQKRNSIKINLISCHCKTWEFCYARNAFLSCDNPDDRRRCWNRKRMSFHNLSSKLIACFCVKEFNLNFIEMKISLARLTPRRYWWNFCWKGEKWNNLSYSCLRMLSHFNRSFLCTHNECLLLQHEHSATGDHIES